VNPGGPTAAPFAPDSISLRLYPHNELEAPEIVRELCGQARLALAGGFDGIMTSEHHGGFAGYLPNPVQVASFVLEETPAGWVAPCPVILALRPVALLAEEVAWLAARHPGRVGVGVAAGALASDFEALEVPMADAVPLFKQRLPRLVAMLEGRDLGPLEGDPALQACGRAGVPVLSAAVSPTAARRAAAVGAGILTEGMSAVPALRRLCDAYAEAGGRQPRVAVRRVWIGEARRDLIDRQRAVYDGYAPRPDVSEDATVVAAEPGEMADRLAEVWTQSGADALNLRVHLPGLGPDAVRRQIEALAGAVLPLLRQARVARRR
jgi:alkanesulfonate monooxygenase SsuD/methylene tetrahydromethanopterin reductase-like flavin-dependent oxidoreductase (luciferase family)